MDKYFQFLYQIVTGNDDCYSLLLQYLYKIEFYSLIPNDDNRGEDGRKLREIYLDNEDPHGSYYLPEGPCTILEMLIGLAYRMENELECGPSRMQMSECFWIFIRNLGLDWANNGEYYQNAADDVIKDTINALLDRKYKRNGKGGIFPLKRSRKNQRKIEIWYQMQEYLLENYF